jgi:hypothetical protein
MEASVLILRQTLNVFHSYFTVSPAVAAGMR